MPSVKNMLAAAAGAAGGDPVNIEDVFHTHLETGTGSAYTVNNGIDLSGEGGLVWIKGRNNSGYNHTLYDTARSGTLFSDTANAASDYASEIASYNNNGFTTVSSGASYNNVSGTDYVAWTFRKAPKFFDIVTYTGNGTAGRTISHNLGTTVGSVWVKRRDSSAYWMIYHKGIHSSNPEYYHLALNETFSFNDLGQSQSNPSNMWNQTAPTSTQITLGSDTNVNEPNATFVAYVFAHNNNDGGFGPDGDKDVIKCGTYTGDGGAGTTEVNLGFEPQWILVKASSAADNWFLIDNMRGWVTHNNQSNDAYILPNTNSAESTGGFLDITSTGFKTTLYSNVNVNNRDYIYIAIRRGPMGIPTSASNVFNVVDRNSSTTPQYKSGFVTDTVINLYTSTGTANRRIYSRLTGDKKLFTEATSAAQDDSDRKWDFMDGFAGVTSDNYDGVMWARAPNYYDTTVYNGTGSAKTEPHNLGIKPDMMWFKKLNSTSNWVVWHKDLTSTTNNYILLDQDFDEQPLSTAWNGSEPTATNINLGTWSQVNQSGSQFICHLFSSLSGISKVGMFTGNGTSQTIDCGFGSGCKLFIVKRLDGTSPWLMFTSHHGIVSGNDTFWFLNDTSQYVTADIVDPTNSGIIINYDSARYMNINNAKYIFYAVAA